MNFSTKKEISIVDLQNEMAANGQKCAMVTVDGMPVGTVCYSSEEDKQAAVKYFEQIVTACNGDLFKMNQTLTALGTLGENDIKADKEIIVEGEKFIISYDKGAAYDSWGKKYASINDIEGYLPKTAIEKILIERIKYKLLEERTCDNDEEDEK